MDAICSHVLAVLRPVGIVVQALSLLIVYVVFFCFEIYMQPFRAPLLAHLEYLAMAVYVLSVYFAVLMSQDGVSDDAESALGVLIVLINVGALVCLAVYLFQESWPRVAAKMGWGSGKGGERATDQPAGAGSRDAIQMVEMNAARESASPRGSSQQGGSSPDGARRAVSRVKGAMVV